MWRGEERTFSEGQHCALKPFQTLALSFTGGAWTVIVLFLSSAGFKNSVLLPRFQSWLVHLGEEFLLCPAGVPEFSERL